MKKLHIYMIRMYLGPFFFTFFIAVFMLLMQFIWKYVDEFVGKGTDPFVMAELFFYASVNFIPMALPLAILLSSLMTFGNIGEHYELTALKSSGISLMRIMNPLVVFILFISICAFLFSNYILPVANLKFYSLLHDVRSQRPEVNIKPGIFYNGIDDYSIRVQGKNNETGMLYGLMIYNHSLRKGNTSLTLADSGKIMLTNDKLYMIINLYNGEKYEELRDESRDARDWTIYSPHQKDKFSEENITIELSGFGLSRTDESLFKDHYHMLNVQQLIQAEDSLIKLAEERKRSFYNQVVDLSLVKKLQPDTFATKNNRKDTVIDPYIAFSDFNNAEKKSLIEQALNFARNQKSFIYGTITDLEARKNWVVKHQIEFHLKFTLTFACIILFFIGAPLGAIIRKGGLGMPVVVSVLLFIMYYILSLAGEKFAKEMVIPAWAGIWMSSVILFPLGLFLTYKAMTDSVIFNIDSYFIIFKKVFGRKKIK